MLNSVFDGMDGLSGVVDPQVLLSKYNARAHPDVVSRKRMPDEVFQEFVDTFDVGAEIEGKVTRNEFLRYYKNIAIAMDGDYRTLQNIIEAVWGVQRGPPRRPMSRTTGSIGRGKESVTASRLRNAKTMSHGYR